MTALLLALFLQASPAPAPPDPTEMCAVVVQCGRPRPDGCTLAQVQGLDDVEYDEDRCRPVRLLAERGFAPVVASDLPFRVFRFLGRRHHVIYEISGSLPVSAARLRYVIDDLPLAARLVSQFQERDYGAEYVDPAHRRFKGHKEDVVQGEVELLSGSAAEGRLLYYGVGISKVAFWRLRGQMFTDIEFHRDPATPGATAYRVRIHTSPESGALKKIMGLGVFKRVVETQVREVLEDVTASAHKLEAQGMKAVAGWPAEEQAKVQQLLRIP